jgi:hypothetical protein
MTTIRTHGVRAGAGVLLAFTLAGHPAAQATKNIHLEPLGTYASGLFNAAAAEIVAHDPSTQRLLVINATTPSTSSTSATHRRRRSCFQSTRCPTGRRRTASRCATG